MLRKTILRFNTSYKLAILLLSFGYFVFVPIDSVSGVTGRESVSVIVACGVAAPRVLFWTHLSTIQC